MKDLSRHFIEYWNYASYQTHYAERYILFSKPNQMNWFKKIKNFAERVVDGNGKKRKEKENEYLES